MAYRLRQAHERAGMSAQKPREDYVSEPQTVGEILDRLPAPAGSRQTLPAPTVTPMQMLATAVERGASVEMMERLLTLQERWEANEARKAFVHALAAFKADPPTVIKNKHVSYAGRGGGGAEYDHATLDQVCNVIAPALSRHGLSHRWETSQHDGIISVTCILTHELGHSERVTLQAAPDTSGAKNAIQAVGSAVSYLQRYTLLSATGLAASDQDNDGIADMNTGPISNAQMAELSQMIADTGADEKKFCAYMGVEHLADIQAIHFSTAKAALIQKAKQK